MDEEFDDGRGETVVRTGDPYARITCLLIAAYSHTDSPGGSTGPGAKSAINDCRVVDEEFDDGRGETVVRTGDPYSRIVLRLVSQAHLG